MNNRKPDKSEAIKLAIRESGLRATPARIATLELLTEASGPLTHAEVAAELRGLGIDKTTVFRNLNDLVGSGLVRRTEMGGHAWRFEIIAKDNHDGSAHPHFVCVDCGGISCMDEVKLTKGSIRMSREFGEVTEILLRGHCNECS